MGPAPMIRQSASATSPANSAIRTAQPTGSVNAPDAAVHALGQRVREFSGNADVVLGEGTRAMRADQPSIAAKLIQARSASSAVAAKPERIHRHQRTDSKIRPNRPHHRTDIDDLARELVAHNQRWHTQRVMSQVSTKLRSTNASMPDLHQDLIGRRGRFPLFPQLHPPRRFPDQCSHVNRLLPFLRFDPPQAPELYLPPKAASHHRTSVCRRSSCGKHWQLDTRIHL